MIFVFKYLCSWYLLYQIQEFLLQFSHIPFGKLGGGLIPSKKMNHKRKKKLIQNKLFHTIFQNFWFIKGIFFPSEKHRHQFFLTFKTFSVLVVNFFRLPKKNKEMLRLWNNHHGVIAISKWCRSNEISIQLHLSLKINTIVQSMVAQHRLTTKTMRNSLKTCIISVFWNYYIIL